MRRFPQWSLAVILFLLLSLVVVWGRRDAFAQADARLRADSSEPSWEEKEERERQRELEWRFREMELKSADIRAQAARLERAITLAEVSQHELATAAYAIVQIRAIAGEERAAEILLEILKDVKQAPLERVVRLELAQVYADRDQAGEAVEQLRKLIASE